MQTVNLPITGMTCGGCTSKVSRALEALAGVGNVDVALSSGQATVQYDENVTSVAQLKSAVTAAGFGVGADEGAQRSPSKGGCCA